MRTVAGGTITQALIDTQKDATRTPYIDITIDGTNYWSRLEYLEYHEEAYRDRATIGLNNRDHALDGLDLDGKEFAIKLGYDTSGNGGITTDTVTYPTLWVKSHQIISSPGQRIYQIYAEGMWMRLREQTILPGVADGVDALYQNSFNRTYTPYGLMKLIIETAMGWTLEDNPPDDGIINSFYPVFEINTYGLENAAAALYRLIWMTKCFIRPKANKTFQIVYPQDADSPDETYYSYQADWFTEYAEKSILLIPNSIIVLANEGDDGQFSNKIIGTAKDQDQIDKYIEIIKPFLVGSITTQVDANNRAEAILSKLKSEILGGRLIAPHDCRVELYDNVQVVDRRGL